MEIKEHILLSSLTTLKVGGEVRIFCNVSSVDEVKDAIVRADSLNLPIAVIGEGSNVLASDDPTPALVLHVGIMDIEWKDLETEMSATVGAGVSWDFFVSETISRQLYELENLSGIPGTVGASPIQNIGAYGSEVKDTIESVRTINRHTGEEKVFSKKDCLFGYRDSFFKSSKGKEWIVTHVTFRLLKNGVINTSYKDLSSVFAGKNPTLADVRRAVLEIRSKKFPDLRMFGTAGSFFKNPILSKNDFDNFILKFPEAPHFSVDNGEKIPLAWVLDRLGLKGYRKGNVSLFNNQPLVLIAHSGATASEIDMFASDVEKIVAEKTRIILEREVQNFLKK